MFYFVAGWLCAGLVCRIGDRAAVLALLGTKEEVFAMWQVKTLSIPLAEIVEVELYEEHA